MTLSNNFPPWRIVARLYWQWRNWTFPLVRLIKLPSYWLLHQWCGRTSTTWHISWFPSCSTCCYQIYRISSKSLLKNSMRSSKERVRLPHPVLMPRVIPRGKRLGSWVIKSLRRPAVRSFVIIARLMAAPTWHIILVTAIAMTRIVSPLTQPQESQPMLRSLSRNLGATSRWPSCRPCLKLMQKPSNLVSPRNARSVSMTLVAILTVNRELGVTTWDFV